MSQSGRQNIISIHALREEGDNKDGTMTIMASKFLSTPSARRATTASTQSKKFWQISIHALREEGDATFFTRVVKRVKFLSTPSARRATIEDLIEPEAVEHFYPRPPRGGRQEV